MHLKEKANAGIASGFYEQTDWQAITVVRFYSGAEPGCQAACVTKVFTQ